MTLVLSFLAVLFGFSGTTTVYHGCTPADSEVRNFLGIPLGDSIDFIRWKLTIQADRYELSCEYGLAQPSTRGFSNGTQVAFGGALSKQKNYYTLQHERKALNILEINPNIIHLLNGNKRFMVGNGGYSYALNNASPVRTSQFNFSSSPVVRSEMVYQGRTPCQEISSLMGLQKGPECIKMKWYVILYTDPASGKPLYYLKGGRGYRKSTMTRGSWEIIRRQDGKVFYKLYSDNNGSPVYLLKADDDILFFTDADGNLLVGNEDFSYTLNVTRDMEPK